MHIDPAKYNSQNDMDTGSYKKIVDVVKAYTSRDQNKPNFVIYLGDIVGHKSGQQGRVDFVKEKHRRRFSRSTLGLS